MINKDLSEVLKKGGVALLIRIMGFLAGYLFIYFTVRYFGAETQGRLSLSFSIMILGSLLCRLGVDTHFVKIFAIQGNFDSAKGIYFKMVPRFLIISGVASVLVYFFSETISNVIFKDPSLQVFLEWTAPCIFMYTFILMNAAVFRGMRMNALYSFLFNGGRFLFTFTFFWILIFGLDKVPHYAIVAHTMAVGALFFLSFFYIIKYLKPFRFATEYKIVAFVKDSLPMMLSASMIVFLGWADTIVLGIYKESDQVGIYSVALKIAAVTSFTFQALDSILAPKLSKAFHSNEKSQFRKLVVFSTKINFLVSLLAVIFILTFNKFILGIFGEEFLIAYLALAILCVGQLFNAICGPVGSILQMTGHQKVFQNVLLVALLINIALNLLLVKEYGINGVAVATAVSLSFWNIASVIYIKRKRIY